MSVEDNIPDGTVEREASIIENDNESKKDVADFRIQLATLEDIKEEILIGCRKQEDQATKEFESLESSLQTLYVFRYLTIYFSKPQSCLYLRMTAMQSHSFKAK